MNQKLIALMIIAVLAIVLVSGCAAPETKTVIKSQDEVRKTVTNVSKDIEDVSATLKDLDESLK